MHKFIRKTAALSLIIISILLITPVSVMAGFKKENPDTGYVAVIEDDADLLSDDEEDMLLNEMYPITKFGSVAFKSIDYNSTSTESYIKEYYRSLFGSKSGTVFMIDMDNRNIYIFSNGAIYRTITKTYANTITDNTYKYATDGDYYTCAAKSFSQIYILLDGGHISQPKKYICNALLALTASFLVCFIIVKSVSAKQAAANEELLGKIYTKCDIINPHTTLIDHTRVYDPPSSGDGGGSSGGGGGGHSF